MITISNSPTDRWAALSNAVKRSYESMDWLRQLTRQLVLEYAGPTYGDNNLKDKLTNRMRQAVNAYVAMTSANRPEVEVLSNRREMEAFANNFQFAINALIKEIGLEYTLQMWVKDAVISGNGIIKVHLAESAPVQFETDLWMDPGVPFASNIALDDFVLDMGPSKFSECKFIGDMYRIPFEDLEAGIEQGMYLPHASELQPTSKLALDGERLEEVSKGQRLDADEFEPMVDLADIWVPRDGKIYTFAVEKRREFIIKGDPISEMGWEDDHGPYHRLGFDTVPNNILNASLAGDLWKLDATINSLMRKAAEQADNQKQLLGYTAAGSRTAKNIVRANDGDSVLMESPGEAKVFQFGGVDPGNQAFTAGLLDMFDMQAGNLTALLGLGAQADTLGQEELIHQAGSRMIGFMQQRVVDATTRLVRSLGFMLWHDEFKTIVGQWEVPGTNGVSVDMTWEPGDREGNLLDYEFVIGIHSMPYRPPAQRVQAMTSILQQIHIPLYEAIAAQGGAIDFQELNEIYAKVGMPELRKVLTWANPRPDEQQDPTLSLRKPNTSTRTYVRKSQGSQQPANNNQSQQAWLSAAGRQTGRMSES